MGNNFENWVTHHNTNEVEKCPLDLLTVQEPTALNYWLKRFAVKAIKTIGELYSPTTLYLRHDTNFNINQWELYCMIMDAST